MKALLLLSLGAAVWLCLGRADDLDHAGSTKESPGSEAFVSRRLGSEVVKQQKRSFSRARGPAAASDGTASPLEAQREVCELSPACDELADQIGFQEAYRRFYGPV